MPSLGIELVPGYEGPRVASSNLPFSLGPASTTTQERLRTPTPILRSAEKARLYISKNSSLRACFCFRLSNAPSKLRFQCDFRRDWAPSAEFRRVMNSEDKKSRYSAASLFRSASLSDGWRSPLSPSHNEEGAGGGSESEWRTADKKPDQARPVGLAL